MCTGGAAYKSSTDRIHGQINYAVAINKENQKAIALSNYDRYQSRVKQIDVRYHFVREPLKVTIIVLQYTGTKSQLADF